MKKKGFFSRIAEGKGFYIALIICVIAVGIGTWAVLRSADNTGMGVTARIPDNKEDVVFKPQTPVPSASASASVKPVITPSPSKNPQNPVSFIWPVNGDISTPYSVDALIYNPTMADWRTHSGVDIKCDIGTDVVSCADGKVAGIENGGMLGTTIIIEHSGGLKSIYANLNTAVNVSVGDNVKSGEVIGKVGETTVSEAGTEPHLHFEMTLEGNRVNPAEYLPKR